MLAASLDWERIVGLVAQPDAIPVFLMIGLVALFAALSATEQDNRKDSTAD